MASIALQEVVLSMVLGLIFAFWWENSGRWAVRGPWS